MMSIDEQHCQNTQREFINPEACALRQAMHGIEAEVAKIAANDPGVSGQR